MGRRSNVQKMPKAVRDWLDAALIEGNFSGYVLLADELRARGYEVSKSGLQRYGSTLEQHLATVRDTALSMQMLDRSMADDEDRKSAGLMTLIQAEIFKSLLAVKDLGEQEGADPVKRATVLSLIGKNAAATVRASIEAKRHQQARTAAEDAAAPPPAPTVEVRFVGVPEKPAPGAPEGAGEA